MTEKGEGEKRWIDSTVRDLERGQNDRAQERSDAMDEKTHGILPLYEVEKNWIQRTLRDLNGDLDRTAKALGIGRSTLYVKLKLYAKEDAAAEAAKAETEE